MFDAIVNDIANKFINNVLFVDEQAFQPSISGDSPDKQKTLDVVAVARAFSDAEKICGFYAPKTISDIEKCKKLVLKPDIVVLDWDIKIDVAFTKEEEGLDDETDDRGHYSLELLKTIVEEAGGDKLRVVFIYTGETAIEGIVEEVLSKLGAGFKKNGENCEVYSDNIHILVRLKPDSKVKYTDYSRFKVSYGDLPRILVSTFANYVKGLVPCFAMSSLTAMRESAARVLNIYNSELDAELLGHQMALSNPDDAKSYLTSSFSSAISELVMDNPNINTDNWVDSWIDSRFASEEKIISFMGSNLSVSSDKLKDFFSKRRTIPLKKNINSSFSSNYNASEDKLKKDLSILFHVDGEDVPLSRFEFAALAHHKHLLSSCNYAPSLTQGTVIKDNKGNFFLCIQQRCDTARVKISGMNYTFIPLNKNKLAPSMGAIALGPNEYYYIRRSSKEIVLMHFTPLQDDRPVKAVFKDGKYVFTNTEGDYEWINELKDMISQRIVSDFASHLARVGVDEAEWLRIEGNETK